MANMKTIYAAKGFIKLKVFLGKFFNLKMFLQQRFNKRHGNFALLL